MFGHIFVYKLKELAHKPWCIGWNLLFPIVLACAFYIGFGNFLTDSGEMAKVDVAVVEADTSEETDAETNEASEIFTDLVRELDFLNAHFVSEDEAMQLLTDGDVAGILYAPGAESSESDGSAEDAFSGSGSSDPSLVISENGLDQTILSQFVKSYIIRKSEIEAVLSETQDPEKIQAAVDMISENMSFGSDDIDLRYSADNESSDSSPYMHYYFALIAMTCLYGSWMSSNVLNSVMADQSEIGKRYECAPVSKFTTISASLFAGLIFLFMCVSALILFIQYVLGLSFNAPLGLIFLLSAAASMAGVSFGVMFGALFGRSQAALTAIPLIFSMGCSFLSGLMLGNMQQIIEVSAPWLNRINPAAVLADGLEELCTYGLGKGYFVDLFTLLAMSCVTIFISSLFLRRKSYASI